MTIRFPRPLAALVLSFNALAVTACGGGSGDAGGVTAPPAPQVGSVSVSLPAATVQMGASLTATVEVRSTTGVALSGRAVTWTSSNSAFATVTDAGVITGVSPGTVTITATSDGRSGTATLQVVPAPVNVVTLTLPAATLVSARTMQGVVELRDERNATLTGRTVAWASSNPAVATVDAAGLITGVASGTTTISASAEGKSSTAELTVVPPPVNSVLVTLAQGTVTQGSSTNATAVLRDDLGVTLSGRTVTWSSANPLVAAVSAAGAVTAVGVGSTTITATSEGRSGSATITVLPVPVATVQVTLAQASILPGGTTQAQAVPRDAAGNPLAGRTVQWSSSNPAVATVNASGQVVGVAVGSATISATSEGRVGQAVLAVNPRVASVVITGSSRVKVGDSYTYTLTARAADGTVVSRPAIWGVRETTRATISQSGVLVPQTAGSFTIVVQIDGEPWEATYSAYDWQSSSASGSSFAVLEADAQVSNRLGTLDYPELVVACSSTGNFFVWVETPHIITHNGAVAFSFDGGGSIGQTWGELSPEFNTLFKQGSNFTVRSFAMELASARRFTFAFGEFPSNTTRVAQFRVTGLASRVAPLLAQCPAALRAEGASMPVEQGPSAADMERLVAALGRRKSQVNAADARLRQQAGPAAATRRLLETWPTSTLPDQVVARRVPR